MNPRQEFRQTLDAAVARDPEQPSLRELMRSGVDLRGFDLSKFDLRYAVFRDCSLQATTLPPEERLQGADLTGSRRDPLDPPVPGWTLVDGRLARIPEPPPAGRAAHMLDPDPEFGTGWLEAASFPRWSGESPERG
jgi:uncharacterized protein YjbI with pentapeptide repeats